MDELKVESVTYKGADPDTALSFPDFVVVGTYKNEPFSVTVGLSLDDREADFDVQNGLVGVDPENEMLDLQVEIFEKVYETAAYAEAVEAYKNAPEV